jgi:hypothetical protein
MNNPVYIQNRYTYFHDMAVKTIAIYCSQLDEER